MTELSRNVNVLRKIRRSRQLLLIHKTVGVHDGRCVDNRTVAGPRRTVLPEPGRVTREPARPTTLQSRRSPALDVEVGGGNYLDKSQGRISGGSVSLRRKLGRYLRSRPGAWLLQKGRDGHSNLLGDRYRNTNWSSLPA